jgi:predicted transcriptional regulator
MAARHWEPLFYRVFLATVSPMTAPSPKQLALQAVEQLPDDATLEDAMERLYVLESIERGRADVAAGRVVPHDEVRRRLGVR